MMKKVNHYTDDFKLQVVQVYLNTDAGFIEVRKKYGLRSVVLPENNPPTFQLDPKNAALSLNQEG